MTPASERADDDADASPKYVCVICRRIVSYEPPLPPIYPFCSPRCKWVDLGRWLAEEYSIDAEPSAAELGEFLDQGLADAPADERDDSP
ncbi:MAG: DNA gyrase inhibitor YacG [Planctomycetota bacterium]|nr:MAG: DNA gyrase inhibitor YacG [Planctomycetota bacterium]